MHRGMCLSGWAVGDLLVAATDGERPAGGPAAPSQQPAGVPRPKASATGQPHTRAEQSGLPFADIQWAQPPIRLCPTAPWCLQEVAAGWGKWCQQYHQAYGAGTDCHSAAGGEGRMGPVPPPGVVRIDPAAWGPCDGVSWGRWASHPPLSLSLVLPLLLPALTPS